MRVGLNALHLVPRETGGSEVYARQLLPALIAEQPELRLTVFASREGAPSLRAERWADAAEIVELPVRARSRPRRVLAEQSLLPVAVRRARVDLLHNLFTTAPVLPGVPQVTTIHDVIYKHHPEAHQGVMARGMAALVPLAARRSGRVITVSRSAKEDIVRFLGVTPDRVDVTYLGPGVAAEGEVTASAIRERFDTGNGALVLTVTPMRAHKNLERLLAAFAGIDSSRPPVLVVPGYSTPYGRRLRELAARSPAADRIRFVGWVDNATLDGLYRAADCFVFPSLAEGFGLPVLEAMIRGTPVACSNATSLPEVAGEAALYFDPNDAAAITASLTRLLEDAELRRRLSEAGRERARRFSWDATARATLESYARLVSRDGSARRRAGG
jgi:glycosyltransferase involved in cell wall biosynthesis